MNMSPFTWMLLACLSSCGLQVLKKSLAGALGRDGDEGEGYAAVSKAVDAASSIACLVGLGAFVYALVY